MASNEGGPPAPVAGLRRMSRRKSVSDHLATEGGDPIVYGKIARLKSLVQQKVDKLDTQRRLAEQANNILCRKDADGLLEHSRLTCRSLDVAIAVARKPGYFNYYTGTEEVKKIESGRVLNQLAGKIKAVQKEIDQVTAEMDSIRRAGEEKPIMALTTTDQWMRMYGGPTGYDVGMHAFKPGAEPPKGFMSTFTPNPKIFGKTSHHPAFRSQAVTLKRARLTG